MFVSWARFVWRPILCAIALSAWAGSAAAADIKMLASNAVKESYTRLVPEFEKSSGHHVTVIWGGTADIMKSVRAGEVQDIVITTRDSIEALTKEGKLAQGSRVDLAKSVIGVASRPGAPKPNLTSGETLKQSLLASKKIILSG
jgi:molybdate transport system substrate-binding protein